MSDDSFEHYNIDSVARFKSPDQLTLWLEGIENLVNAYERVEIESCDEVLQGPHPERILGDSERESVRWLVNELRESLANADTFACAWYAAQLGMWKEREKIFWDNRDAIKSLYKIANNSPAQKRKEKANSRRNRAKEMLAADSKISQKEIARELGLSTKTVQRYLNDE